MLKHICVLLCVGAILAKPNDQRMHPKPKTTAKDAANPENSQDFWNKNAINTLKEHIAKANNKNVAKNVILFLGDGMSVPTLAATRAHLGDMNNQLAFDKFPHTALSKTYCVDYNVPDSACTATAYLGGVKGNMGTIGVNGDVKLNDCDAMTNPDNHVNSIAKWALDNGKDAGLVTTARVTHASPAGVYGHTANRNWESDTTVVEDGQDPLKCQDLAVQLLTSEVGSRLKVIMGGGRWAFLPSNATDEEGDAGYRSDGRNLIEEWIQSKNATGQYIHNRTQLVDLDVDKTEYVLGLFKSDHCPYDLHREAIDPSLTEMTDAAIKMLSKNEKGYFLFVEGARIDMAHHEAKAHLALGDTAEFSNAIQRAVNLTSENDTLIVVTSDHAHTLSISGYPSREMGIYEIIKDEADDHKPYTVLSYANGPGYAKAEAVDGEDGRHDLSADNTKDLDFVFPGSVPLYSETHGGDDVIIFAQGPQSHLFKGVIEQNVIPHIMAYASCLSDGDTACDEHNAATIHTALFSLIFIYVVHLLL